MLTLSKIAKLANVSVSTASKAFSMSPEVNEETREAIFAVAKKHGCFQKFFNAKYPKLVVAVMCPELDSLYYTNNVARLQSLFEKSNCEVCIATTHFSTERARTLMNYYSKYAKVDGIVLLDCGSAIEAAGDMPVVCAGWGPEGSTRVVIDRTSALEEAVNHFLRAGITEIGFIGEHFTLSKRQDFIDYMKKRIGSYDERFIGIGDRFADGAYHTMKKMIDEKRVPRALICGYDYLAIGAMRCLAEHGYKIPEDVAIIGMDDIPEAKFLTPSLSSISNNSATMCEAVASTLIKRMMGKPYEEHTTIEATLHLRESSRI